MWWIVYFAFIFKLVETPGVCVLWGRGGGTPIFSYIHIAWTIFLLKILKFNIYLGFFWGFFGGRGGGVRKNE